MKTGYALWNLVGDKALSKPSVLLEAPAEGSDHGGSVAGWEGAVPWSQLLTPQPV